MLVFYKTESSLGHTNDVNNDTVDLSKLLTFSVQKPSIPEKKKKKGPGRH